MNIFLAGFFAYVLGMIPSALIVVYLFTGRDVRVGGSKNMGAMNTLRTVKKYKNLSLAFIAFLLVWVSDMGKAVVAVIVAEHLVPGSGFAVAVATFFCILGHNYPLILKGKGGRGAASFMGILLYIDWRLFFIWNIGIYFFMIVTELLFCLLRKEKITKQTFVHAIGEQIIGRLVGECAVLYFVYLLAPHFFVAAVAGTALIIVRHKRRLLDQIASLRK